MRNLFLVTGLCGVMALLGGCGGSSPFGGSNGGVAVVDLDEVAKRLGRDVQMKKSIGLKKATLDQQLKAFQAGMRKALQDKAAEFGESPTPEQQKQLQSIHLRARIQMKQLQRSLHAELAQHKQQLINRFREEMKPTIRQIADDNGWSIVIPKDQNLLLTVKPAAEITDAVIERALESAGTKPSAPPRTASSTNKKTTTPEKKRTTSAAN